MQTSAHHHIRWGACRWGHGGPGRGRDSKPGLPTSVSAGPGCTGSGQPQSARPPHAARSRCTAAAVVFDSLEPPAATAPSTHLPSQLSQPHLAPTCPVGTGLGLCCPPRRQLVEMGVGRQGWGRSSSGRARGEWQPLPLCDLELLGLSGLGLL